MKTTLRAGRWVMVIAGVMLLVAAIACTMPSNEGTLVIINGSGQPLCNIYTTEDSTNGWGENRVADGAQIADGEQLSITLPNGTYDLRVETCDGSAATREDEPITGRLEWTITPPNQ